MTDQPAVTRQRLTDRARAQLEGHRARVAAWTLGALVAWLLAGAVLPAGLPLGVVLQGVVLGSLTALAAMGLVLVYRANRIINFAQAEIGGLAATLAVIMVAGWHFSYFVALPAGLLVAGLTGWIIDFAVIQRFVNAPRLIPTVATIAVAQILGWIEINLPSAVTHLRPLSTFRTPFQVHFRVGPLIFNGDEVLAVVLVAAIVLAMTWFFRQTDTGIAVRAAADSHERATLLGIPVRRLSRITWVLAAVLSAIAAMLSTPILGAQIGLAAGPVVLLGPLTAAVIAGMESLPIAFAAAIAIGVFEQAVFWSYPRSSTVDVALFVVVLLALLLRRRTYTRVDDAGMGGYTMLREIRPLPIELARLPEVRWARAAGLVAVVLLVFGAPWFLSGSSLELLTYTVIFTIVGVSLVVVTGWAGQMSLGQFAFAGIGGLTTGALLAHANIDLIVALAIGGAVAAIAAVLIGLPALRIPGPFLPVATLAFAVPVSTYLGNATYFPTLNPASLDRPVLFGRFQLDSKVFYLFCLVVLVVFVLMARNFRRTRAGRAVRAVRDNARCAACFAIEPARMKLSAFAFSGLIAGVAGGLYVVGLRGVPHAGFDPIASLTIFTTTVIGGIALIPGALIGGASNQLGSYFGHAFLNGTIALLAPGVGLLVVLAMNPGGLADELFRRRDDLLRVIARRRAIDVPSLVGRADEAAPSADRTGAAARPIEQASMTAAPVLSCSDVEAAYGQVQILFGITGEVRDGEILALLGTNGAGKSTLVRVLAGLLPAAAGRVEFAGQDLRKVPPIERVKRGIVTVPGGRGVFGSLTVAEHLRLAGWLYRGDRAFIADTERRVLRLFPVLSERLDVKASLLSGGEQQMLAIAIAMYCRPRLLMIDELTLGLAPAVVRDLLDAVREINADGTAVLIVEQSLNVASELSGRALFLERGQVRFEGPTNELVERPDLVRSVFLRAGQPAARRPTRRRRAGDEPVLELRNIVRRFGGVVALDGASVTLERGQILGLIGANGAGKTTLMDVCSGLLRADEGAIVLGGHDVTKLSAAQRAQAGLGRSFQDARLFPSFTVREAIAAACERSVQVKDPFLCSLHTRAVFLSEQDVRRRADELIAVMGLGRFRDAFINELSTGTRRIVELACTMAHEPSVLLLDEPSSGIAQAETDALGQLLLDLRERTGASLLVIEHDIPLISSIADRVACLERGRVLAAGTPKQVLAHRDVVASYLGGTQASSTSTTSRAANGRRPNALEPAGAVE